MTRTALLVVRGLVSVALFGLLALLAGYRVLNRRVRDEAQMLFAQARRAEGRIVTEDMLEGLPAPVRRYFAYARVVGKPMPRTVRLKQVGRLRQDVGQPWIPLDAEEYFTVQPPAFVWLGTVRMAGLPVVRARDRYVRGTGGMLITAASLITHADAIGEEMDQGALMRYLNEATLWFPAALLSENFSFEPIDDRSARVTLTDRGKTVTATLYVDDEGKPTDFVGPRYRTVDGHYELETWSTPIAGYGEFEGTRLGVRGKAVWKLKEGDLEYIDLVVTKLEYDVDGPY